MSDNPKPKSKSSMFRASIIYSGKLASRTGVCFLKAKNKEEAQLFIENITKDLLRKTNEPEDCFQVKISPSSKDEVDFYVQSRASTKNYTGLVN